VSRNFILLTKPNCCLCTEAKEELRKALEENPFEYVEKNILEDWELYQRYKEAIPVLICNGDEWFRLRFTAADLLTRLKQEG
jgi:hypothetical protein